MDCELEVVGLCSWLIVVGGLGDEICGMMSKCHGLHTWHLGNVIPGGG